MQRQSLPIDPFLPEVADRLKESAFLVLRAAPGAGKTTRIPPALLDAGLADQGAIWVLEPRRVAARSAARRMAQERGQALGREVGYRIRFDHRQGPDTRILVVTEGILTGRLQQDPFLEGISVIILDEFHERSIHSDLALAFLKELCGSVRPDLKVVVMSATLNTAPLCAFLEDCPVMDIPVEHHPVDLRYLDRRDERPLWIKAAAGVERALHENQEQGDLLVFLPGMAEIRRTREQLEASVKDRLILPLHGSLPGEAQDQALSPQSRQKIILSTNLAETSLTIEGVTTVVDTGFARILRHDPRCGLDRLELGRISRASARQRAGRAGRQGPGTAYRLWTRGEHASLAKEELPEIARIDLASTLLEIFAWGATNPDTFGWFEKPAPSSLERAMKLLVRLGAVTEIDRPSLTALGASLARLPLHPRLGRILLASLDKGFVEEGALMAALLSERDLMPSPPQTTGPSDLLLRMECFQEGQREKFRGRVLRRLGLANGPVHSVQQAARQFKKMAQGRKPSKRAPTDEELMRILLVGFPDRLARRRAKGKNEVILVGGRGARLSRESMVREAEFLLALSVEGGRKGIHSQSLIRMASQVELDWILNDFPDRLTRQSSITFDEAEEKVTARESLLFEDLVLQEKESPALARKEGQKVLIEAVQRAPDRALAWEGPATEFRSRVQCLRQWMPELDLPALDEEDLHSLLPLVCAGRTSFEETRKVPLLPLLKGLLSPVQYAGLQKNAPEKVEVPSGRQASLHYVPGEPPILAVRLQELFGLMKTPTVAGGRITVLLHLLGPNQRPVQITHDLESFWKNTYAQVRKDLRGRYPKHAWPEDPLKASPLRGVPRKPPRK